MAHPYGHYQQVDLGLRKLGLSELPPIVKFNKLPIGARFRFFSEILFPTSGMASGPWIKTGANTYAHVDPKSPYNRAGKIRVGKAGVETFQVAEGVNPPVPGLSGWAKHAGGTAGGGRHGYTFTTGPWPARRYYISPITTTQGRFAGYVLQSTPGAVGLWENLGTFRSPQTAAKAARAHFADVATANPPGRFRHERLKSPAALRRKGLTKIRTVKSGAHRLRIAYPPGRRRAGAGEVQAVLHPKGNPARSGWWIYTYRGIPTTIYTQKEIDRLPPSIRVSSDGPFPSRAAAMAAFRSKTAKRQKIPLASTYKEIVNPPVKVYERVNEIIAVKGPGHRCDAACKRARHTYRHKFTGKAGIYGNPDGSLTVR